ncbi:MAG: hypothetical protein DSZ06_04650, partial [Sulfurospirillum sp.]
MANVSLSVDKNEVFENESVTYKATLSEALSDAVIVKLSNNQSININAGETEGTISSGPLDEDFYIDPRDIEVSIQSAIKSTLFGEEPIDINQSSSSVSIYAKDTINTTYVGILAEEVDEDQDGIKFTVRLTQAPKNPIDVTVDIGGQDYTLHFPVDSKVQTQFIATQDPDVYIDSQEIVGKIKSISSGSKDGDFEEIKIHPDYKEAIGKITDTIDETKVSLSATDAKENEDAVFTAELSHLAENDVEVELSNGETITIEKGKLTGEWKYQQGDDVYVDGESKKVSIKSVTEKDQNGRKLESLVIDQNKKEATAEITDTIDETKVSLDPTVNANNVTFKISLDHKVLKDTKITLNQNDIDGNPITVTVPSGKDYVETTATMKPGEYNVEVKSIDHVGSEVNDLEAVKLPEAKHIKISIDVAPVCIDVKEDEDICEEGNIFVGEKQYDLRVEDDRPADERGDDEGP